MSQSCSGSSKLTSERVKDAKGRLIPSVMVQLTDDATLESMEDKLGDDFEQVLILLDTTPGMSQAKIAEALGWVSDFGPDKAKVNRTLRTTAKSRASPNQTCAANIASPKRAKTPLQN